jgi:hypothetical protein
VAAFEFPPQIDLSKGRLQYTSEDEIEREYRLRREEAAAKLERHKDLVLFYVILAGSAAIFFLAIYVGFVHPTATSDARQWAMGVLSAMLAGPGGYILAKKSRE